MPLYYVAIIGLDLVLGCKPPSGSLPKELKEWKRARYESGGGDALVLYVVYGYFTNDFKISRTTYRSEGVPRGVALRKLTRAEGPVLPFTVGDFGRVLGKDNPNLFARVEQAPECLVIQGQIADPPDLNYLRDCVGVIMYLMDSGGVAVTDAQQLRFYDAAQWRREFFEPAALRTSRHVTILVSEEKSNGRWIHTRGMRKFGRPDLSLHNDQEKYEKAAVEMCNRFVELQASGGRIPEGEDIRMNSLPSGLVCHHKGNVDDPDFNNVHVEIQFPSDR